MASSNHNVAEIQGLYGPFTMTERVVQKIWLHRDFEQMGMVLADGRTLQVRSVGVWNLLSGPDFRDARLSIDGHEITGDVEVHFHASDWRAHGHEFDKAYDKVVLHVVLFPLDPKEKPALRGQQELIPTLVLLPLLHRDLEEYASDDALETITARDEWRYFAGLALHSPTELKTLLRNKARKRWEQKIHFAELRIEKLGWRTALHQTALEILGYRLNRAPMMTVAIHHPLEAWREGIDVHTIFSDARTCWRLRGVRPANHPLVRLEQYRRWVTANPHWPDQVPEFLEEFLANNPADAPTKLARQLLRLNECRKVIANDLLAGAVGGMRLNNLVCDGLLPLLGAKTRNDFFALWFHWFMGDIPDQVRRTLPKLGLADGRMQPLCHGYAQGLLSWFLECEARASG